MVKMIALDGSGNDWLWDRNKFINRKFLMQEMYQNYVEGDADWDVPQVCNCNITLFVSVTSQASNPLSPA
jgi:hypothetical protein